MCTVKSLKRKNIYKLCNLSIHITSHWNDYYNVWMICLRKFLLVHQTTNKCSFFITETNVYIAGGFSWRNREITLHLHKIESFIFMMITYNFTDSWGHRDRQFKKMNPNILIQVNIFVGRWDKVQNYWSLWNVMILQYMKRCNFLKGATF